MSVERSGACRGDESANVAGNGLHLQTREHNKGRLHVIISARTQARIALVWALLSAVAANNGCGGAITRCTNEQVVCNEACTTLARDPTNCGACGHACGAGELCSVGECS